MQYTRDIQHAMRRLEYHMHNYLVRLYEVRERSLVLVATHTGATKRIAAKLKKPSLRAATAAQLRPTKPKLIDGTVRLLGLLDQDVELRNTQTHKEHLQLGLWRNGGVINPEDVIIELEEDAELFLKLKRVLRKEIRRVVSEHRSKGQSIWQAGIEIVDVIKQRRPQKSLKPV